MQLCGFGAVICGVLEDRRCFGAGGMDPWRAPAFSPCWGAASDQISVDKALPFFKKKKKFHYFLSKSLEASIMTLSPGSFSTDFYIKKSILDVSVAAWNMATWLLLTF